MKGYQDMKLKKYAGFKPNYSLLINKFQELYNVNILIKAGMNQADLADLFHISPSGRAYYGLKMQRASLWNLSKCIYKPKSVGLSN